MGQQKILGDIERVGRRNPDAQRFPGAHGFDAVNVTFGHFPSATGSPAAAERSHALRQSNVEERSSEPVPLPSTGADLLAVPPMDEPGTQRRREAEGKPLRNRIRQVPRRPVTIFPAASSTPLENGQTNVCRVEQIFRRQRNRLTNEAVFARSYPDSVRIRRNRSGVEVHGAESKGNS